MLEVNLELNCPDNIPLIYYKMESVAPPAIMTPYPYVLGLIPPSTAENISIWAYHKNGSSPWDYFDLSRWYVFQPYQQNRTLGNYTLPLGFRYFTSPALGTPVPGSVHVGAVFSIYYQ